MLLWRRAVAPLIVLVPLLAACSDDDTPEPVGIMWGSGATGAFVEDTVPLLAFYRDGAGNAQGLPLPGLIWSSSNPSVLAIVANTSAVALDTGITTLTAISNATSYTLKMPFRVIPRWQGRLVWSRSPDDGGQPRLAVQELPSHVWHQLPDLGYPGSGTGDAYLSSDGRYVAATGTRQTSPVAPRTIFVLDLVNGGVGAPLNPQPGDQFSAAWFPGDTMLAFLMGATTGWEVFTVRPDGSDVQQRTRLGQSFPPFFDLTPEGNLVLGLRTTAGGKDLFEVTLAGDTTARLTTTTGYEEGDPAVSPDGAAIAYVATRVAVSGQALDVSRVWVMDRDGANPRPLLPPLKEITGRIAVTATSFSPSWSPDSKVVLLTWSIDPYRRPDGSYYAFPDLYAIRLADGLAIRLTENAGADAQPFFR